MSVVKAGPEVLFGPGYWDRADEIDAAAAAQDPVMYVTMPNGLKAWVIMGYDDARRALTDPGLSKDAHLITHFMCAQTGEPVSPEMIRVYGPHLLFHDATEHTRLRRLIESHFGPERIRALRPQIARIADEVLGAVPGTFPMDRPVDLLDAFATPFAQAVTNELLGLPEADRRALNRVLAGLTPELHESMTPTSPEIADYLTELIGRRRARPGADLLSAMATAVVDGDRLSDQEVMATAFLMMVSGSPMVTHLIGNATRRLVEDSAVWRALPENPGVLGRAVEDVLLVDSPMRLATYRCTTGTVVYGGRRIRAGEIVLISLCSANRDLTNLLDSDEPLREQPTCPYAPATWEAGRYALAGAGLAAGAHPNRPGSDGDGTTDGGHLAFGHGVHHCLAATLVRTQAEIALGTLAIRFPAARLAVPAAELGRLPSAFVNGYQQLPVYLTAS